MKIEVENQLKNIKKPYKKLKGFYYIFTHEKGFIWGKSKNNPIMNSSYFKLFFYLITSFITSLAIFLGLIHIFSISTTAKIIIFTSIFNSFIGYLDTCYLVYFRRLEKKNFFYSIGNFFYWIFQYLNIRLKNEIFISKGFSEFLEVFSFFGGLISIAPLVIGFKNFFLMHSSSDNFFSWYYIILSFYQFFLFDKIFEINLYSNYFPNLLIKILFTLPLLLISFISIAGGCLLCFFLSTGPSSNKKNKDFGVCVCLFGAILGIFFGYLGVVFFKIDDSFVFDEKRFYLKIGKCLLSASAVLIFFTLSREMRKNYQINLYRLLRNRKKIFL